MEKYGLIGAKLPHSFSKDIHTELGLDYELIELENTQRLDYHMKNHSLSGFNVTIPYKQDVIPYLTQLDEVATQIGAVNTVKVFGGKMYGYNTDAYGMEYALTRANICLRNKVVMILGSGGTSKTANYVAHKLGASKIIIVSRTRQINYKNCYELEPQVIINTTPQGMYPNILAEPIDLASFKGVESVFDAIYNPIRTSLLLTAKRLGINYANGLRMLVAQAVKAYSIFTDTCPNDAIIESIYHRLLDQKTNIYLVGMPGAGKSAIGKLVADKLNKPFCDTDDMIVSATNNAPKDIINKYGEERFRQIEREVVNKLTNKVGSVVALGGGAVLSEVNRSILASTGYVVYIDRPLSSLDVTDRPLSKDIISLANIRAIREPLYNQVSDCVVQNESSIDIAVERIIENYEKHLDN